LNIVVIRANERKRHRLHSPGYTLSKRYQQAENVKSMKIVAFLVWYSTFNNCIFGTLFFLHNGDFSRSTRNFLGSLIDLHAALYAFTMCFMGFIVNKQMFNLVKRIVMKKWKETSWCFCRHYIAHPTRVFDVHGKVLYTGANQNDYFSQLEAQWTIRLPSISEESKEIKF
ncbi:unnamed protein product, partial [Mesorhabditis belari]|uniref:Uncharacterized protein n=1 Tax=Mesorhabditis belari TaxID=2138241 RepID=A0AAF3EBY3_9BILA